MTQKQKMMAKAKRHPEGLRFIEFQNLMCQWGWDKDHQRGSHEIWYSPQGIRISVQNRNGLAKGYQVRQFLKYLTEDNS